MGFGAVGHRLTFSCPFVGAPQNVNYGVNLILRGLVLQPGDVILTLDTE